MTWGEGGVGKGVHGYQPLRCDGDDELPGLDVAVLWRDLPLFLGPHTRELLVGDPIHVDHPGKTSMWRKYSRTRDRQTAAEQPKVVDLLREMMTAARESLRPP